MKWSWGLHAPYDAATGMAKAKARLSELEIVKKVDQSSPTLMTFLKNNKVAKSAKLTVRKAGKTPLEYYTIELENVRITSVKNDSEEAELVERVNLGFTKVTVSYTPQDATGARGGGANVFEASSLDA
jgi:type VI secretion system secreted protein Hcp